MRAGSNFEPVPHGVLAGMFGRVPQPVIFHMWSAPPAELQNGTARFRVGLLLTNRSPVIARDVYLTVSIFPPGGNSQIAVEFPDLQNWSASQAFGFITQVLANENFRLAPEVIVKPVNLTFSLIPPFRERFHMKITAGCSGSSIWQFSHELSPAQLEHAYNHLVTNFADVQARHGFPSKIIGSENERVEGGT